jgi:hypothetical protein
MKKPFAWLAVRQVAWLSFLWMPTAKTSQNDEAEMTSFRRCNILDSTHIKKTIRNFSTSSRVAMILNIEPKHHYRR